MPRITSLKYRFVEKYDFWDITYYLDNIAYCRTYLQSRKIQDLDMSIPDVIAFLLRAELDCVPVRGVETFDK
jgi:hypothetical protein